MLKLYNDHTKEYLSLLNESVFSFTGTNQLQDLEKYDVGYSFDIELVNDSNSRDAVLGEWYDEGTTTMSWNGATIDIDITKLPHVILYNDDVPMFIGKMSPIGTTLSTIKAVYKCVPYGRTFKDFDMRSSLKDYFVHGAYNNHQVRSLLDKDIISITGADKNPNTVFDPAIFCYNPNRAGLNSTYRFDSSVSVDNPETTEYVRFIDGVNQTNYWWITPITQFLQCMNIRVPDAEESELQALEMDYILGNKEAFLSSSALIAHPVSIGYKRDIKVRFYKSEIHQNYIVFKPNSVSEIWWWNESFGDFERLGGCSDYGSSMEAFSSSIRVCKGLDGLKMKKIEYPKDFTQKGILTLNTDNAYRSIDFGIAYGHEYKDNDDLTLKLESANIVNYTIADFVDVTYELELSMGIDKVKTYNSDYNTYNLYKSIPVMDYDIEILNSSTSDFLNMLSLHNSKYKWLRNPSYINAYNKELIHNIDNIKIYDVARLKPDNVESVYKTIKYDTPSFIEVKIPTGFATTALKRLNYSNGETKQVEHTMTGLGWCGTGLGETDPGLASGVVTEGFVKTGKTRGTPPIVLNRADGTYLNMDIKAAFGTANSFTIHQRGPIIWKQIWWYLDCNSDFDFLEDYADKSQEYHFTVIGGTMDYGYSMQEKFTFEGKTFVVGEYKTSDFMKYEIVAYLETPWIKREGYVEAQYDVAAQKFVYTSAEADRRVNRNEITPNGRQVQTRKATR